MIATVQYMIRFSIIESLNVPHALDHLYYFFGVLCSMSLAAGGYIINDLNDLEADEINKPGRVTIGKKIGITSARQLYFGLSLLAIFSGYLVSKAAGMISLTLLPVLAIALLYFYAIQLKKIAVVGNLVVSLLTALPILLVTLFDLIPVIDIDNQDTIRSVTQVIAAYGGFAFVLNWIREMVKDAEDYRGDKKQGYKTLAVLLGNDQIRYVILILSLALISFTGFYNAYLFHNDMLSAIYVLVFVNVPLIYFLVLIFKAKRPLDFKRASGLIKIIMLAGMLSMVVFTLSLKMNW
jgi:4-hydroxybenzoate polyprenyltransferase